ncbi:DUF6090 family protein [Algoriphagus namhaensis]|uniref:DUF6090 family protein n=1 Tax=Algoriphagus namhaensis TaxID=915353 RepID=A0ABV8APH0_9BACT
MEKNKAGKYLKYAIGEIALVMIGILLALQVSTWNETRRNQALEDEFKIGLKNDLLRDKENIEFCLANIEGKILAHEILTNNLSESYDTDKEQLDSLFHFLLQPLVSFFPVSGTFDTAISSGNISNFTDKELIEKAHYLYNSKYPRLVYNGELVDQRNLRIRELYVREIRRNEIGNFDSDRLEDLLDDIDRVNFGNGFRKTIFEETLQLIDEILAN